MSFTGHTLGNIDGLADAAKTVLEGKVNVYELAASLTDEDASDFITAAAHAKEEGKSHFMFNGKSYPVTIGDDVAKQIEAKLDPVGKEDDDIDNDGDTDDSDEYLKKRRDAIDKAIDDEEEKESVEEEVGKSQDGVYKSNDEIAPDTKTGHADADAEPEVKDGEEEEAEKPKEVKPKKMKESTNKKRRTKKKIKAESVETLVDGLIGISETAQALSDKMAKRFELDEGKMKELHQDIEAGKSADEIIKINKLPNTPGMKKYINALIKDIKG